MSNLSQKIFDQPEILTSIIYHLKNYYAMKVDKCYKYIVRSIKLQIVTDNF